MHGGIPNIILLSFESFIISSMLSTIDFTDLPQSKSLVPPIRKILDGFKDTTSL